MSDTEAIPLSDRAYLKIQEMIVTLQLAPGSIVSANDISRVLGIGRMPVRDAFRKLEVDGLVSILPRKGILVSSIRTDDRTKAILVDEEFNLLLGACSKNPFAWQALSPFYARFQRIYYHHYEANEEQVRKDDLAHAELMRGIAAGSEGAALESLSRLHANREEPILRRDHGRA